MIRLFCWIIPFVLDGKSSCDVIVVKCHLRGANNVIHGIILQVLQDSNLPSK